MKQAELVKISKALSDPTRMKIYDRIANHPETICGALVEEFGLSPATVSHHLKVLADAGLIESRRRGQFIHNCTLLDTMKKYTQSLTGICKPTKHDRKR